jgi:integrase/recombinase XerD
MSSNNGREPKEYLAEKVKDGKVSKADAKVILDFIKDRIVTENIASSTAASYARYLSVAMENIGKPIKNWDYTTFTDFSTLVKGKHEANTYRKHISTMKSFLLYLIANEVITSIKKEQIERVKIPKSNLLTKKPSDMLSVNDVNAIIGGARNSRDRAIIATAFESGCRPVELISLEWEDVNFDEYGCTLTTNKKTQKPRRVRMINYVNHLIAWKNDYPMEPVGTNPVFVNLDTKVHHSMSRGALKKLLQKAVAKSGVTKHVHMYLFRHSRVTDMLAQEIPTSVIGGQFWGSVDSQMLKTYGHLSDKQSDDILIRHAGSRKVEVKVSESKPISCPKCGVENAAGLQYCGKCGTVLDAVKYQESIKVDDSLAAQIADMKEQLTILKLVLQEAGIKTVRSQKIDIKELEQIQT